MAERRRRPRKAKLPEPPADHETVRQLAVSSMDRFDVAAKRLIRALNRYEQRERGR